LRGLLGELTAGDAEALGELTKALFDAGGGGGRGRGGGEREGGAG